MYRMEIAALEKQLADTQIKSPAPLVVPEAISSEPLISVMAKVKIIISCLNLTEKKAVFSNSFFNCG